MFEKEIAVEPAEFPCYVYTQLREWGTLQLEAVYLYKSDLKFMLRQMED